MSKQLRKHFKLRWENMLTSLLRRDISMLRRGKELRPLLKIHYRLYLERIAKSYIRSGYVSHWLILNDLYFSTSVLHVTVPLQDVCNMTVESQPAWTSQYCHKYSNTKALPDTESWSQHENQSRRQENRFRLRLHDTVLKSGWSNFCCNAFCMLIYTTVVRATECTTFRKHFHATSGNERRGYCFSSSVFWWIIQ